MSFHTIMLIFLIAAILGNLTFWGRVTLDWWQRRSEPSHAVWSCKRCARPLRRISRDLLCDACSDVVLDIAQAVRSDR